MGTSPSVTAGPLSSLQSTSYLPKLEQNFMRDFRCCDQKFSTLHDLLEHYEENHHNNPSNPLGTSTDKQGLFPTQGGSRQPNSRPTQSNTSILSRQNGLPGMGMQMPIIHGKERKWPEAWKDIPRATAAQERPPQGTYTVTSRVILTSHN